MAERFNIRCRQIGPQDLPAVIDLLVRGFPTRSRAYWERGLARHGDRRLPDGVPRFGYLLESGGRPVGVLLVLASSGVTEGRPVTRCNLSSWYVEPEFRSFAAQLMSVAVRSKDVTYVNISASQHTWPMVEAFGFAPYCFGRFTAFPLLARRAPGGVQVVAIEPAGDPHGWPHLPEFDLLRSHAGYGWLSLVCRTPAGDHPFVFQPFRRWHGRLPGTRLIYCRDLGEFTRFARPLGRHLLRHGIPWVAIDANGPIPGLPGFFRTRGERQYFRGPDRPRLGDLAYTEAALFGP
jgi:hypothetical protein